MLSEKRGWRLRFVDGSTHSAVSPIRAHREHGRPPEHFLLALAHGAQALIRGLEDILVKNTDSWV